MQLIFKITFFLGTLPLIKTLMTFLSFPMTYQITEPGPGCQLIYRQIDSPVAHIALFSECGTRHEGNFPEGISHFLEHMIFKGTRRRKTFHLLAGLENTGCDVNAYTSKEELVLHASFLEESGPRIIGLLAEIVFESAFPEQEIEKERNVILDEIASIKDSPSELILEQFEKYFYSKHPLHREILGNKSSLQKIDRKVLLDFYNSVFLKSRKVIVYYGKKSQSKVLKLIQSTFGNYLNVFGSDTVKSQYSPAVARVFEKTETKSTHQTHVLMGAPAYDVQNSKKNALGLLINILGGQASNSRLNLLIREKLGLSYSIDAFYNIFADNGYYSVYFSTENGNASKIISHVKKEIKKLREQKIGTLQLHIAKKQLIGQTAIYLDSVGNDMLSAGKIYFYTGKVPMFEEIRSVIDAVTAKELLDVANEVMVTEMQSTLIYEPRYKNKIN